MNYDNFNNNDSLTPMYRSGELVAEFLSVRNSITVTKENALHAHEHIKNVRMKIIGHYQHVREFMDREFGERETELKKLWEEYEHWKEIDKEIAVTVLKLYVDYLKKSPESGKDIDISTPPANNGTAFTTGGFWGRR